MRYTEHKPTSTAWVESIPIAWDCKKIGALFSQRKTKVSDKDYPALSVAKIGVVSQLDTAVKTDAGDNRKLVCANDFVINSRSDRKGSCGVSELDGSVSLINIVLTPRQEWNNRYVHYLLRSQPFSEEYYRYGRGIVADLWTTRYSEMKNILLPVPPRAEQDQIVRYLDWQVSKINKLIAAKKKQIALLKEYELLQCNELLLRGANPSAALVDSGSNWMGSIPNNWKTSSIARHFSIKKRIAGSEGYDILSITQQGIKVKDISANEGQMAANYVGYQFVYLGDFAMNHMDLLTGYIDISAFEGVTSPDYRVFVLNDTDNCYPCYYLNIFQLCYKRRIFYGYGKGAANKGRWRLPADNFKRFVIPLPPYDEQVRIADAIKEQTSVLDEICTRWQKEIDALHELHTRIISDVVTGQIDVRNIEVPDFELVGEFVEEELPDEEVDASEVDIQ